jgi:hypothetical protein
MIKAAGFLLTIVALQAEADGALAAEGERFRPTAAGIVAEPASGLEWTAADNGYDLDWTAANASAPTYGLTAAKAGVCRQQPNCSGLSTIPAATKLIAA